MEKIGVNAKITKIAVTGNLSSGKTAVCQFFRERGAYVVDADAIVRDLISRDSECIEKIIQLLGTQVVVQGQIRHNLVADMVFANPSLLTKLEQILHPKVALAIKEAASHADALFVAEVPLLFESGMHTLFDYTIAVEADQEIRLARSTKKGLTEKDYYQRLKRQLPQEELVKRADFVITNRGSLEDLSQQVDTIINQIRS